MQLRQELSLENLKKLATRAFKKINSQTSITESASYGFFWDAKGFRLRGHNSGRKELDQSQIAQLEREQGIGSKKSTICAENVAVFFDNRKIKYSLVWGKDSKFGFKAACKKGKEESCQKLLQQHGITDLYEAIQTRFTAQQLEKFGYSSLR